MHYENNSARNELLFNLGLKLFNSGNLKESEKIFLQIIPFKDSFFYLGLIYKNQGNYSGAIEKLFESIKYKPDFFDAYLNLGICQNLTGKYDEAIESFNKAILIKPDESIAYANLGSIYQFTGNYADSIDNYTKYLKYNPSDSRIYNNIGMLCEAIGKPDEAEANYFRAINIQNTNDMYYFNLGILYYSQKKYSEAMKYLSIALEKNPNEPEYYNSIGNIFQKLEQYDKAESYFRNAIKLNKNDSDYLANLGGILNLKGKTDESIKTYSEAINIEPFNLVYYFNLGISYEDVGKYEEAEFCHRKAIEIKPDYPEPHLNLSLLMLLKENFSDGLKEYEWRFLTEESIKIISSKPRWNGEDISSKTLCVKNEQGLGDSIQFFRYLKLLGSKDCKIIFECPAKLKHLYSFQEGYYDELVEYKSNQEIQNDYDFYIPLMSLPFIFKTDKNNIPAEIPYIKSNQESNEKWAKIFNDYNFFKIGITWEGNPSHKKNKRRSCPVEYFYKLARDLNIKLFSIQKGNAVNQLNIKNERIIDLSPFIDDFSDTASIINNLDLVISVDTSVVHLAGAMGKNVWTLLNFLPDWRWGLEKEDTLWYPSMRLFRQKSMNDWNSVFEEIRRQVVSSK